MLRVTLLQNLKVPVSEESAERQVKLAGTQFTAKSQKEFPAWLQSEVKAGSPAIKLEKGVKEPEPEPVAEEVKEEEPAPAPKKKKAAPKKKLRSK